MSLGHSEKNTQLAADNGSRHALAEAESEPFQAAPVARHDQRSNLRNLNLNLLPIFQVLTEQQSLSRAAVILGMSQSAVSHALTKLRAHFDDPLFVRVKQGVEPTAKALQLSTPISLALNLIRDEVILRDQDGVQPAALQFQCGITDPLDEGPALLTALMQGVRQVSAQATLTCSTVGGLDWKRMLRLRQLDLVCDSKPAQEGCLASELVMQRDMVCYVREGNPVAEREFNLPSYLAASHVIMEVAAGVTNSTLRQSLTAAGLERTIAARVQSHSHAALMASQSDLVGTGFRQDVAHYARQFRLRILPCPVPTEPSPLYLTWLRVRSGERLHRQLRRAVIDLCRAEV